MATRPKNRWVVLSLTLVALQSSGCYGNATNSTGCNLGADLSPGMPPGTLKPSLISGEQCCAIPTIDPSRVTVDFVVVATNDVTEPWRLDATIGWFPPPNNSLVDYGYSVGFRTTTDLQDLETLESDTFRRLDPVDCDLPLVERLPARCPEQVRFREVASETSAVFSDLLFGFKYQLEIQVVADGVISSTHSCIIECRDPRECPGTVAPDCLEATGDEEFCRDQTIAVSSKPRNFSAELAVNSTGSTYLGLRWLGSFQVNRFGHMEAYRITINNVNRTVWPTKDVPICSPPNATCSYEVPIDDPNVRQFSLERGESYVITVQPRVDLSSYYPGMVRNGNGASLTVDVPLAAATTPAMKTSSRFTDRGRVHMAPDNTTPEPPGSFPVIVVAVAACVIVLVTAFLFALLVFTMPRMKDRYLNTKESIFVKELSAHKGSTVTALPEFAEKEIFGDNIVLQSEALGSGQYGQVYAGLIAADKLQDEMIQVAVKTTRGGLSAALKEEFLDEIRLMLDIGEHPNIMAVLGCRTVEEPYYLVIEYMAYGSLKDYLRKTQKPEYVLADSNYELTEKGKLDIAHQISCGMTFLSTTRYFHGDLAARNVLINEKMVVKVSDFGLSNDIYARGYVRLPPEQKRPVKWYSPEANLHGRCSTKGDVWSFGVVLYEIYTSGGEPYPMMHPREVIQKVNRGYRMDKPAGCPDKMYNLMLNCWQYEAASRPPFSSIKKDLESFLDDWDAIIPPTSKDDVDGKSDSKRYSLASFSSDRSLTGEGGEIETDFS